MLMWAQMLSILLFTGSILTALSLHFLFSVVFIYALVQIHLFLGCTEKGELIDDSLCLKGFCLEISLLYD